MNIFAISIKKIYTKLSNFVYSNFYRNVFRLPQIERDLIWLPGTDYPDPKDTSTIKPALCEGNMEICGLRQIFYKRAAALDDTAMEGIVFRCCPPSKIRKF